MDFDIVLTTYATIRAEVFSKQVNQYRRSPLKEIKWFRMVLDEGIGESYWKSGPDSS